MSRPRREWYPGATYHVMSRGNRRLILYKDHDDYLSFLAGIVKTKEKYSFKIHSLCLMTNHFHMIIETEDDELWKIMQRMLHPYSMNFNRKHHYTGHLFEHRYTEHSNISNILVPVTIKKVLLILQIFYNYDVDV